MLYARATCDSPPEKSCPYSENERAAEFSIRRADITLDDGVAPTITTAGGPLLSGSLIDRPSEFTVSASDRGSGVAAVQLLIDGRVTATYPVEESPSTVTRTALRDDGNFLLVITTQVTAQAEKTPLSGKRSKARPSRSHRPLCYPRDPAVVPDEKPVGAPARVTEL
jgi:hypothetical protein